MAEKLDAKQMVTLEELLRACPYEQEALRRVLVRKGLVSNEEVLEEGKVVRRELEGKRGAQAKDLSRQAMKLLEPAVGVEPTTC